MTFLQALRKIRPLIEGRQFKYICLALQDIGAGKYRHRVQKLLGRFEAYEDWLLARHTIAYFNMKHDGFRQGRLQWIDYMIAQELKK